MFIQTIIYLQRNIQVHRVNILSSTRTSSLLWFDCVHHKISSHSWRCNNNQRWSTCTAPVIPFDQQNYLFSSFSFVPRRWPWTGRSLRNLRYARYFIWFPRIFVDTNFHNGKPARRMDLFIYTHSMGESRTNRLYYHSATCQNDFSSSRSGTDDRYADIIAIS